MPAKHFVKPRDIVAGRDAYTAGCGRVLPIERLTALAVCVTCKTCLSAIERERAEREANGSASA